jgi:hypothetical protein
MLFKRAAVKRQGVYGFFLTIPCIQTGQDYAADYSFRYFQRIERKTPRRLKYIKSFSVNWYQLEPEKSSAIKFCGNFFCMDSYFCS